MAGFGKRKTKAEFRFRVTSTHSWYRGYWRKTGSLAVRNVYPKADSGRPGREFVANPDCPATSSSGRATSSRDVLLGRCRSRQIKTRVQRVRGPSERPDRHALLVGAHAHFCGARESDGGYLRALKRLLVDIYVSKDALYRALWPWPTNCFSL
jgi:hypothetical protein